MNRILELLNNGVKEKSAYSGPLCDLTAETDKLLKDSGYNPNAEIYSFKLIGETTEARLKTVTDALASASENTKCLLPGAALRYRNGMEKFLDNYKIGFIKELYINEYGTIVVKLGMSIMAGLFPDSARKLQEQLEVLNNLGLTFVNKPKQPIYIVANDSNKEILCNLLKSIGAKNIQYSMYESRLNVPIYDTVSFWIQPSEFDVYCLERFNPVLKAEEPADILTDKELKVLKSNIEKLITTVPCLNTDPDSIIYIGQILESLIHECCKIVGVKTEISQRYGNRIETEKDRAKKLQDMEKKVEDLSKTINVKSETKKLAEELNIWISSRFPFCLGDIRISQYQTNIKIIHDPVLDIDEISKYNDLELVTIIDDIYVIANDHNFAKIEAMLKEKFPDSEVTGYEIQGIMANRIIKSLSVTLRQYD